ncbi:FAD/NAD-P-binding domain-containing protein [Auriscalpium vulgare]|uniref:FAD/NAD-P-binding domain-containing protein n=1 Tax=Auriscalpium vulgare TaxID=40419 RepID=A0ACB8R8X0_9AGAM|nr:FAD/NAD-P-binding domain-containing protein [Auriscalpium vulgare]
MTSDASPTVPTNTQVLVIGGGPAGSYAATLLARDGYEVTLLEREVFPRYHVGETLLPSASPFLSLIDGVDLISRHGFTRKVGAAVKLNQYSREGYTDFVALDSDNISWNVVRSEFDDLLLKNAGKNGVKVHEGVKVAKIHFTEDGARPTSADWTTKDGGSGTVNFEWLIDASGRAGILSTQYLRNRNWTKSLKNVAVWGYWKGAKPYAPGTSRENAPWFEALTDESGWSWCIPLHDGTVSVGFVMTEDVSIAKRKEMRDRVRDTDRSPMRAHYEDQVKFTPGLGKLLEHATLNEDIHSGSDWSYSAAAYSGDHFRIIGDAGAFIDPFFSSGVHLAFTGGLSAACTIGASIRGQCTEKEANSFHDLKVGTAYTRFLILVLGVYKQVKAQKVPVLQDIDENNFDNAFNLLRPILQGAGEVGKELSENEVAQAVDFCGRLFNPATPEMYEAVSRRVDPQLLRPDGPVLLSEQIKEKFGAHDEEAIHVLHSVNARKPLHSMFEVHNHFSHESFEGYVTTTDRGDLGLKKVAAAA